MKIKILILLFVLISVYQWLYSITWIIDQSGGGNFTTIQEGIDASVDNDTVLVYPGTYIENVVIEEKNIILGSLYLITQADSLIYQTIIDGNQNGSCIRIESVDTVTVCGFTIMNGSGIEYSGYLYGGGLFIFESECIITDCVIEENFTERGGGLCSWNSHIFLSNLTIRENYSKYFGGGIQLVGNNSTVQFDQENRCSIYLNYSGVGSDFCKAWNTPEVNLIVDTFTVINPDDFYIAPIDDVLINIQNAKIQLVNNDLYVNPNGSDENSGLTPAEPLQTVARAETIIASDSLNPKTIHLADGVYSPSLNNQRFPINVKNHVNIVGENKENTILDADDETPFIYSMNISLPRILTIEKLTFTNSYCNSYAGSIILHGHGNIVNLKDIKITNSEEDNNSAIEFYRGNYYFENVEIVDNIGGRAGIIQGIQGSTEPSIILENCIISRNLPDSQPDWGHGGCIRIQGCYEIPGEYHAVLKNVEISENYNDIYMSGSGGISGLCLFYRMKANLINCTIGNNITENSAGTTMLLYDGAEANFINSIYYGNEGHGMSVGDSCYVSFTNSLYEGGIDNINLYGSAVVEWFGVNIDEEPMWQGAGADWPYSFLSGSPCIDAGTPDTTGLNLPEFDLAGNPRIYNDIIDMGAYEWQGVEMEEDIIIPITQTKLSNYPNPFNPSCAGRSPSTTIKLDLAESGKIELSIYNIKGQKVKTLMDAYSSKGIFELVWRGTDENGNKVSSGQYFVKLKQNGKITVSKIMLLK